MPETPIVSPGPRLAAALAADRSRLNRQRIGIDESARVPVLTFFASSVVWLLVGTVFALLASIKLHSPWFLSRWNWLTFGRVRPAHLNVVAYGWASMAGIGCMLWMMARLSRAELRFPRL